MPASVRSRLLVPASLALGATALTATIGLAAPPPPVSGDPRATAHAGNVTTCAEAGLPGTTVTLSGVEDPTHTFVTIPNSDIPSGETLVDVVVKGGPAYNVYEGLTSWTLLHSPIDPGGNIPTISHWFACLTKANNGGGGPTTTCPTPPPTTTTASTSTGVTPRTSPPGESSGSTSAPTTAPGTTTTIAVAGASPTSITTTGGTSLASTGMGNSWLIWIGVLLLLVGGGLYALPRLVRRRS